MQLERGEVGNGTVTSMKESVGFVKQVSQPLSACKRNCTKPSEVYAGQSRCPACPSCTIVHCRLASVYPGQDVYLSFQNPCASQLLLRGSLQLCRAVGIAFMAIALAGKD